MEEKKLVPKLRFPGFTEPWEQRKLGECMNSFAYGLNAAAKGYDGMHKYIRITDIDDETHNFIQSNLASPDIDFNMDVSHYKLNVGDIVFARTGASVGKTYLYNPNDGDLYYAGFLIRGKVKEDCDSGFIYQNTLTKDYDSFIKITSQRSGQPGVNSKEYAIFRLNIPCKDEQEKISKVLNSLDELFTLHQRKLEHLKLKKKSLLQKLFPKEGEVYPEFRFPGFTDPWEQRKLGEIVKIERGGSPRPIDNYITTDADGLNWIKIGDAPEQGRYIVHAAEKIKSLGLSKTRQVEPGDLILSNSMSFGKPYIMGIHGCIHDGWLLIRNNQNIFDLKFLCNLLGTEQLHAQYRRLAAGSAVNNLNKELVSGTNVGVPSKAEQLKIGQFFESIDQYITLHQRKLEHLQLLKKALLQQLFV